MEKLAVIKVGGNVIDSEEKLLSFLQRFASIKTRKILVHGGGKIASQTAAQQGVEVRMTEGRRITDAAMLKIVTQVYGGLVNKRIVSRLQAAGCNAIGLTGADGDMVRARKRPVKDIDYGFVGDIERVNGDLITRLLDSGLTPVFAPLTHDGKGSMLNTNADTIASEIAAAMSGIYDTELTYCFEKKGVLRDVADDGSVIRQITPAEYITLKAEKIIADGMMPKLDNAWAALDKGVKFVRICHADDITNAAEGTIMQIG